MNRRDDIYEVLIEINSNPEINSLQILFTDGNNELVGRVTKTDETSILRQKIRLYEICTEPDGEGDFVKRKIISDKKFDETYGFLFDENITTHIRDGKRYNVKRVELCPVQNRANEMDKDNKAKEVISMQEARDARSEKIALFMEQTAMNYASPEHEIRGDDKDAPIELLSERFAINDYVTATRRRNAKNNEKEERSM
ncbi:MAG: hypothetical protein FWE45_04680 [Firmicutes bacterium]|nr:hypothetical protein [Bacillota bacterium]